MTIADKLSHILDIKEEIKDALIEKGSDVTDDTPFAEYPEKIQEISVNDGSNITINFLDNFYNLRTINTTDYESLFKDYKGTTLDLTFMCKEFHEIMSGMFADCVNLETLNLTKWIIADDAITSNMFVNVPSLNKIIMNYTDFNSAKRILDELPDYTGAANGDYIFEIKEPKVILDKIVSELGSMYRGWTIIKGANEILKISVEKYNKTTNAISVHTKDAEDLSTNREVVYGDSYGEYIETVNIKNDIILPNHLVIQAKDCSILELNDAVKSFDSVALKILQINPNNRNEPNTFSVYDDFGDYDCSNLKSLEIEVKNQLNDPLINSVYITDYGNLKNIDSLGVSVWGDVFYEYSNTSRSLTIENIDFNNLTNLDLGSARIHNLTFSNINFHKLEYLRVGYRWSTPFTTKITFNNVNAPLLCNLANMFFYCDFLENIDLSGLKVSETQTLNLSGMFAYCDSLKTINLSNWRPVDISNNGDMFDNDGSPYSEMRVEKVIMANCPWYFVEYVMKDTRYFASRGTLYCDMDMSSVLPSGWTWRHSSMYMG